MKRIARETLFAVAVLGLGVELAPASTLVLRNGGRVTGEITNPEQRPRKQFEMRTPSGATISIAADQVEQVLDPKNVLPKYEEILPKMPPNAEGNWTMAEWCGKQELAEERLHHLRVVIEMDPNHAAAREALGYKKSANGAWENPDEGWTALGYKKVGNRYLSQQQIEMEKYDAAIAAQKEKWRDVLKSLNSKATKGKQVDQALNEIRAIEDPIALDYIAGHYLVPAKGAMPKNDAPGPELKKVYISVVAKHPTYPIVSALVYITLNDPVDSVRDYTLQQLVEAKHPATSSLYLGHIQDGIKNFNKDMVNRSAYALGQLDAKETVYPLIAALTMKIRKQSGGSSQGIGATPSFDSNGGAGISAGGKPTIIEEIHSNPEVLAALQRLTKQNFDYNQDAWRRWYIGVNTPNSGNMRRDE